MGMLIGIIFGLGALLVCILPKFQWLTASLLLVLITPLALLPFWLNQGALGISDWDYYFIMHTTLRDAIVNLHQFPLWNPYICGGTSAYGDPESPIFSPLFILELFFGTPAGLRLSIYVATAVGALGMLFLARKLKQHVLGGLIAGLAFAFGTVNLLEIVEGHQNILAFMYLPWIWLTWYCAYRMRAGFNRYTIITAILLALVFFQGGIYLLMYMAMAFMIMPFLVNNPKQAITTTLYSGGLSLALAAVKIAPVMLWLREFQDKMYASSAYTIFSLDKIFLGRILHGAENVIPNQGSGWHEYGAYVGPFILILSIIGFIVYRKNRVAQGLLVAGILALLLSSFGPFLKPFFDQAPFLPRSNISRVILFTVIPMCLLAGYAITWITKRFRFGKTISVILITLAAIDLISLAYPLASQAFVLPPDPTPLARAKYPIQYNPFDYKTRSKGVDYTRAYTATLQGYGTLSYCSVLGPDPAVSIISDEYSDSILTLPDRNPATFSLLSWSPNKVVADISSDKPTSILLNANYAKGWYVNGKPAKEIANKVGTDIPAGTTTLTFQYIPKGMYIGIIITISTIISLCLYIIYLIYYRHEEKRGSGKR